LLEYHEEETEKDTTHDIVDTDDPILDYITGSTTSDDGADIRNVLSAYKARMQQKKQKQPVNSSSNSKTQIQETLTNRQVNMGITYRVSNHATHTFSSLVDRGANGGLAGDDVKIINKTGKFVDVAGIDNHTVNDLELVTAAGFVITNRGPRIVIMHQYAYLGKGKTIHCCAQLEHFKNDVDDKSIHAGGLQRIKTLDGTVIPLAVRSGLTYLDIRPPTDEEFDTLPHIIFTSDDTWDPSVMDYEYDASDDFAASFPDDGYVIDSRFDNVGNYYQTVYHTDLQERSADTLENEHLLLQDAQDCYDHHCLEPVVINTNKFSPPNFITPYDPWMIFNISKDPSREKHGIHEYYGVDTDDPGSEMNEYLSDILPSHPPSCFTFTNVLRPRKPNAKLM